MTDSHDIRRYRQEPPADRLAYQPVCAFCEEPVQGDFYYHIESQDVCWDCLKLHFRRETLT